MDRSQTVEETFVKIAIQEVSVDRVVFLCNDVERRLILVFVIAYCYTQYYCETLLVMIIMMTMLETWDKSGSFIERPHGFFDDDDNYII